MSSSQGKVKIKVDAEKDDIMDEMDEFEKEMAQEMSDRLLQVQQVSSHSLEKTIHEPEHISSLASTFHQ